MKNEKGKMSKLRALVRLMRYVHRLLSASRAVGLRGLHYIHVVLPGPVIVEAWVIDPGPGQRYHVETLERSGSRYEQCIRAWGN